METQHLSHRNTNKCQGKKTLHNLFELVTQQLVLPMLPILMAELTEKLNRLPFPIFWRMKKKIQQEKFIWLFYHCWKRYEEIRRRTATMNIWWVRAGPLVCFSTQDWIAGNMNYKHIRVSRTAFLSIAH